MGYVLPRDEDEEEQQQQGAPQLGGSQSFAAAPGGKAAPITPQTPAAQNVQNKGSGFTNLTNWLDAGKGRDKTISDKSTQLLGAEKTNFAKAAEPVKSATYQAKTVDDVNKGGMVDKFKNNVWDAAQGDAQKKAEIAGMTAQKYEGARDVNYDPNAQKNLWDVANLSNTSTVGNVLARPAIEAGQYGAGMQRLDNVLFGADAASQAAIGGAKKGLTDFGAEVKTEKQALADKVAGFDKAAKDASEGTKKRLGEIGADWNDTINRRVTSAQEAEAKHRQAVADGYAQGADGSWHKVGPGEVAGLTSGGGATRENLATDQERRGFDLLSELIGGEKIGTATGKYEEMKTGMTRDPDYGKTQPMDGVRAGTVVNMLDDRNPEQARVFQKAMEEYGPKNNGQNQGVAWNEFFDRFQREHPDIPLPTGEDARAYEGSSRARDNEARMREGRPAVPGEKDAMINLWKAMQLTKGPNYTYRQFEEEAARGFR